MNRCLRNCSRSSFVPPAFRESLFPPSVISFLRLPLARPWQVFVISSHIVVPNSSFRGGSYYDVFLSQHFNEFEYFRRITPRIRSSSTFNTITGRSTLRIEDRVSRVSHCIASRVFLFFRNMLKLYTIRVGAWTIPANSISREKTDYRLLSK